MKFSGTNGPILFSPLEFTDFAFRIFSIFFYFVYVFIFALSADYLKFFYCVFNPSVFLVRKTPEIQFESSIRLGARVSHVSMIVLFLL
jgi:hypothetical protein